MSKGFRLLRIEYVFTVIIPCLICIYLNGYDVLPHLWILTGFFFYAITGNTLNDVIDMKNPNEKETLERVAGYQHKEILVISLTCFALGSLCFVNIIILNPFQLFYLILIVGLVIIYCKFKRLVIINHIFLGVSHIFLPYFMVKIHAGDTIMNVFPNLALSEWLIVGSITAVAYTGQMVHEMIDGDSLSKLSPRASQLVILISSIISLVLAVVSLIITRYVLFLPIIIFPIGIIYIFRRPRTNLLGRTSLKDTGIILGNLVMIYLIILIIAS